MAIHVSKEGKAKCGARSCWGYGTHLEKPGVPATCRRCLGQVQQRYENVAPGKEYLGKILHHSFGYDMTINEYAKIVKINAKSATAVPVKTMVVAGDPWAPGGTGKARASHEPDGEPFVVFLKAAKQGNWSHWVGNGRSWSVWDGQSNYENHCD